MKGRASGVKAYLAGLGQLHQALLEVRERPLNQAACLLEMVQQSVPQRLLAQHLCCQRPSACMPKLGTTSCSKQCR